MRGNKKIQKLTFILLIILSVYMYAQNPIVPNKGLNDPHIHIFNDTAYVYASHDKSIKNRKFIDYSFSTVATKFGACSVKVLISYKNQNKRF